jgi:hypothetical protein
LIPPKSILVYSWVIGTFGLLASWKAFKLKDKWNIFLRCREDTVFEKEMWVFIRAKLLITRFIIVKVNTAYESRGTFSFLPGNKGRQLFSWTDPLQLITSRQPVEGAPWNMAAVTRSQNRCRAGPGYNGKTMRTTASDSSRLASIDF